MSFSAYYPAGENMYLERYGLDFEDFAPGQRFRHRPGITLSQQDNVTESLETMNGAMLHYDAAYAARTAWKKPLMVSTVTLQRIIGMTSKTFGRRGAITGFAEIALTGPLFGGDTIYAESEVVSVDEAAGAVTVRTFALKDDPHALNGTPVGHFTWTAAIPRRGAAPDPIETPARKEPRFALYHTDSTGVLTEQVGLYFDDLRPGETFIHAPSRSFFLEDSVRHAWQSLEIAPPYHDLQYAERYQDGRVRVSETLVISAVTALTTRTFGRVMANLGWTEVELPLPVHVGDTVYAASTIQETRPSKSRPGEGIVGVTTVAFNQHEQKVLSYHRNLLVYRRDSDAPYARAGY